MLEKLEKSIEQQKAKLAEYSNVIEQVAQLRGSIIALEYAKSLLEPQKDEITKASE